MPVMVAGELVETPLERVKREALPKLEIIAAEAEARRERAARAAEIAKRPAMELMRLTADTELDGKTVAAGTLVLRLNRARSQLSALGIFAYDCEDGDCWVDGLNRYDGRQPDHWPDLGDLLEPAEAGAEMPDMWQVWLLFGRSWHTFYVPKEPLVPGKTTCMFGPICCKPASRTTYRNDFGSVMRIYVCEDHDPGPGKGWWSAD